MKQQHIELFFATLAQAKPEPETELEYTSPFELLCAVLLSAQATDISVNRATRGLFAAARTPAQMLALGREGIEAHIKTLGLFRNKAQHLLQTCQLLLERHNGAVPSSRAELEALPGVGRKTANVVLNVVFGLPTLAVDTHVFRLANRTGLAPGRTPLEVEQRLLERIPARYLQHAHHWLILHGRHVCQARRPLCEACHVSAWCDHFSASKTPKAVTAAGSPKAPAAPKKPAAQTPKRQRATRPAP